MHHASSQPPDRWSTEYENYCETAQTYDDTRSPVGVACILRGFAALARPLHELTILDGGCGTGNYLAAMYTQIGTLHGLDVSQSMLARARHKLPSEAPVHLLRGSLECLPYGDAMFDGMMCNQVVHHLTGVADADPFTRLRHLLAEAYRVLRAGGVLVLNTSSHRQLRDGFWWADLIPTAVNNIARRFPTLTSLQRLVAKAGFDVAGCVVLVDEVLQGKNYLDPSGPFSKSYRAGDSTWSLTTADELQQALARLQGLHNDGSLGAYMQRREHLRRQVGQTTCVFARK